MILSLSLLPKIARRARGGVIRVLITLAGGHCGAGLSVERGFRVRQGFHRGIRIGARVYIGKDVTFDCPVGGELKIGARVTLTQGIFISAIRSVAIGDDALIGEYSSVRDANHGIAPETPIIMQPLVASPVTIGRDVWVGRGCAILAGVTIADGAILGANSVATRDVAAGVIAVGAPARPIGNR